MHRLSRGNYRQHYRARKVCQPHPRARPSEIRQIEPPLCKGRCRTNVRRRDCYIAKINFLSNNPSVASRQLPPGGSLCANTPCAFLLFVFCLSATAFLQPREARGDISRGFRLQKYGISQKRYAVFCIGKTSTNIFTNRENCDMIIMPNELNNRTDRYIFLYGIIIPFFVILLNESIW